MAARVAGIPASELATTPPPAHQLPGLVHNTHNLPARRSPLTEGSGPGTLYRPLVSACRSTAAANNRKAAVGR